MGREFESRKNDLAETKTQLVEAKVKAATGGTAARSKTPAPFSGTPGTVEAWCSLMVSYILLSPPEEAFRIPFTYLVGEACNWWRTYRRNTSVPD